jgi:soluble lytic murein transglycosylase
MGRPLDGAAQLRRVNEPAYLAAAARFNLARSLVQKRDIPTGTRSLRSITARYPADTSAAAALLLLADLATDEGRDDDAVSALEAVVTRFPKTRFEPLALFQLGMIEFVAGRFVAAASHFDRLVREFPGHREVLASLYWRGRSHFSAGDTAGAAASWREILRREPASYYAVRAAPKLGDTLPILRGTDPDSVRFPEVDVTLGRIRILQRAGLPSEAWSEEQALIAAADSSAARAAYTAHAFAAAGETSDAISLGWRAITARPEGRTDSNYRLVFPIVGKEAIAAESREAGLDPVLVAALIRQESNFNPRARSPAGARGLMQVMPSVGRQIARARGIKPWTAERLYEPEVNIEIGITHLGSLVRSYPDVARMLAAYNAGQTRVERWKEQKGTADPEIFIERIPFVETRDYVRTIIRNRAYYARLYEW